MSIWSWLFSQSGGSSATPEVAGPSVNPSTGLPMLEGGGFDVAGNPFGCSFTMSDMPSSIGSDAFSSFSGDSFSSGSDW